MTQFNLLPHGKTITLPHPLIVKLEVWGDYITRFSKSN